MDPQRGVINSPVNSCIVFQYVEKLSPYRANENKAIENKASMMFIWSTDLLKIKAPNYTRLTEIPHHVCDAFTLYKLIGS